MNQSGFNGSCQPRVLKAAHMSTDKGPFQKEHSLPIITLHGAQTSTFFKQKLVIYREI